MAKIMRLFPRKKIVLVISPLLCGEEVYNLLCEQGHLHHTIRRKEICNIEYNISIPADERYRILREEYNWYSSD